MSADSCIPPSPFFSVIIPAYNCAGFLREALQSLRQQTCKDFEVLIADSHSTDGTASVAKEFPDLACTVFSIDIIGNIAASRNLAAAHAKAPWLAFLDADDFWLPEKLAMVKEAIAARPEAVLFCHAEHIFQDGQVFATQHYGPRGPELLPGLLFGGNAFSTAATVLRRDIFVRVGGFDENPSMVTAEDYDLWIRACPLGESVFLQDVLGCYRLHGGNSSARLKRHFDATEAVLRKHLLPYRPRHPWAVYRRMFRFTGRCALDMARNRHWFQAFQYAVRALGYAAAMTLSWRPEGRIYPHSPEECERLP